MMASASLDRLDAALKGIKYPTEFLLRVIDDWGFLGEFWKFAYKRSDAATDEERKNMHICLKIEAIAEEIAQELIRFHEEKMVDDHRVKDAEFLNELALDCGRKVQRLIAEVEEALDHLYMMWSRGGGSPISSSSFVFDNYFCTHLLGYVRSTVSTIETMAANQSGDEDPSLKIHFRSLYDKLRDIQSYLDSLFSHARKNSGATIDDVLQHTHHRFDACVGHVLSLALRIANQCREYWLNCNAGRIQVMRGELIEFLVNLHLEIHPGNPKFMGFLLNFLMALCCTQKFALKDFLWSFCRYLFFVENGQFREEVSFLLKLFCCTTRTLDDEDTARSFIPGIQAVLVEITSLFKSTGRKGDELGNSPRCFELLMKICFLEAELFLVVQIHSMKSNTNTSSLSSIMLPDFKDIMDICRHIPSGMRRYSRNLPPETRLDRKKLLALIESTFKEEKSLYESSRRKKITASAATNSLLRLRFKIVIFKGESFLTELLLVSRNDEKLMARVKDQINVHLRKLEYITLILSDERVKGKEDILGAIEESFRRLTCFSYYFLNTQDEMTSLSFSEQLDNVIHLIKGKLTNIIPQFPKLNFPKASNLELFDFLCRRLGEFLRHDPASTVLVKHHVEEIQMYLKSLRSFLENVSELDIEKHSELEDLLVRASDSAYKVEYIVDSSEVDAQSLEFFWFGDVVEELRLLSEKARGIQLTTPDAEVQNSMNVTQVVLDRLSRNSTPAINEIVVDLSNRGNEILSQLIGGSPQLDIVAIVGMPGLGKTTLARKVYDSEHVRYYFHCRSWCTVSHVYEKRRVLIEILKGIHGLMDEIHQMSDEELESKLKKCLLRNKYLIVMDDVWDVEFWNDLKKSFPDDRNGSRILLTSRLHQVALEIKPERDPLSPCLFSHEESWKLLEKKVFKEERCSEELLAVGQEIALLCQGLPLAVVAVAGILKKTEKSQISWKRIADSFSLQNIDNPEAQCKEVLELSYKHLPEYLKPCFLYLGALNGDRDIRVSKLIRFWLAEGFIPQTKKKSYENVAENFLMDLIDRSLVTITQRRSNNKVKACRLHDLVLDFCKSKTKETNFFQLVTRFDHPYASFPSSDYGFEFDFYRHSSPVSFASYRLAISLKRNHFVESKPSGLATRSLVFFASMDSEPRCPYDISFICHNFKLLKVLDLECINLGVSFPVEIELLLYLTYLAAGGYIRSIPHSIANLRKLETLVVKGLRGKIILPNTIWRMTCLRHLHVNVHVAFDSNFQKFGDSSVLENLVSFSCPSLSCGEDAKRIIKRLPNLCKLSCIFYESQDSSTSCSQFPRLNFLSHLESLKIFYYGNPLHNGKFNLPLSLKELTLSRFCLPWNHISAIGSLPNLEVLKLLSGAFMGQTWHMMEDEFQKLKFLSLDTLDIAEWNATYDHLPKLERLVLQHCKNLEKIPEDFADITSLETIEVHWCGQSVEESAIEIGKATGEIKVLIRSSNLRS